MHASVGIVSLEMCPQFGQVSMDIVIMEVSVARSIRKYSTEYLRKQLRLECGRFVPAG
jgi:hypothetical protein